ncbi:dTDP-4-dehydrorhamnose reductase [Rhodobacteraceae bacterium NNCM2]|nr:dTDP-4-dehydrorhamnose reductase [Coraliihabitans acroporae]
MKILMFGQTGQVATELQRRAGDGIDIQALPRSEADLTDPAACAAQIAATDADIIINAAAYTAVDKAEDDLETAMAVNGTSPTAMAKAAAKRGIPFLHISTDYVFDGAGTRPWREVDPAAPLGAYGRTKRAGEEGIIAAGGDHVILRTAWVFAAHGGNFVRTMLRVGAARDTLNVVDDQRGGPTAVCDIADALLAIAARWQAGKGVSGIYHFCGAPAVTWCGFAKAIFAEAGMGTTVVAIPSSEYPTPAPRPANSVLDCAKITRDYGVGQPDWQVALKEIIKEIKDQPS